MSNKSYLLRPLYGGCGVSVRFAFERNGSSLPSHDLSVWRKNLYAWRHCKINKPIGVIQIAQFNRQSTSRMKSVKSLIDFTFGKFTRTLKNETNLKQLGNSPPPSPKFINSLIPSPILSPILFTEQVVPVEPIGTRPHPMVITLIYLPKTAHFILGKRGWKLYGDRVQSGGGLS